MLYLPALVLLKISNRKIQRVNRVHYVRLAAPLQLKGSFLLASGADAGVCLAALVNRAIVLETRAA